LLVLQLYHHGEDIAVNVHIANNSNRSVKKIKVTGTCDGVLSGGSQLTELVCLFAVRQFADICLFSTAQYKCTVAEVESE
jgi:beta-arrestin